MNYLGSNPVKIIGERTSNNLINQNLLIGKTGVSRAIFDGYDCIKMTAGTAILPFYCKAGEAVRLSFDLAYEDGIDTYWFFRYADGTNSSITLVSISTTSATKSFSRRTATKVIPTKDVVGILIQRYKTDANKKIIYVKDMMMNYGETVEPYVPYNQLWRVRSGALIRNPKNLIPFPYVMTNRPNGISFEIKNDGTIIANGKNDGTSDSVCYLAKGFILPKGTYTARISIPSSSSYLTFLAKGKYYSATKAKPVTITFDEETTITGMYVQIAKGVSYVFENTEIRATLYEGTEDKPYHIQD